VKSNDMPGNYEQHSYKVLDPRNFTCNLILVVAATSGKTVLWLTT